MADYSKAISGQTVGLDLGDKHSWAAVLDGEGTKVQSCRVSTSTSALQRFFGRLGPCRVALEAGTHASWVSRLVRGLGHEVIVANSRKLRLIYENDRKDDRVDAEYLARLARVDPKLLSPVQVRSEQAQADWGVLEARRRLVEARTNLVNHCRGAVKKTGRLIERKGGGKKAKKVAVAAVARKLAVLMHRLWVTGEVYEPFYNAQPQAAF